MTDKDRQLLRNKFLVTTQRYIKLIKQISTTRNLSLARKTGRQKIY